MSSTPTSGSPHTQAHLSSSAGERATARPPRAARYMCIHGHFYQPPRENPWLEEIEREESAQPAHDWNERIAEECYKPNAAARILDSEGRIIELKNNYEHLSFNFGPTLLRWMARHSPVAYRAVLDADRRSALAHGGHGNAIAQVYNHVILPLANLRDKHTQIRWGIRDFEHRFRRKPEGMWLAETAVDRETLGALADNGIRFTVLSPYQAQRWRFHGATSWTPASHGDIPSGRAYAHHQPGKPPIHLFFYDGAIARGIAFERLLQDSSNLVGALHHAHAQRRGAQPDEPWLVNTATDGESYGHHFPHGDMALAAAFARLERDPSTAITNYAAFLSQHPVRADAELLEVSAWSCAHGVGRWSRDCGCRVGGGPLWNQRWREHLREALNTLRDALAALYERAMSRLVKDPWATRDAYIDVILEQLRARTFVAEQTGRDLSQDDVIRFFALLELQRSALLMFTSCGWFFDDISGGESILLLKYAARALELARSIDAPAGDAAEQRFQEQLARAESNVLGPRGEKVTGRSLFVEKARPVAVSFDKVVVSYALRALTEGARRSSNLYAYRVTHHEEVALTKGAVPCLVGRVSVEDTRTLAQADTVYALAHFGSLDFRCCTRRWVSDDDTRMVVDSVRAAAVEGSTAAMMRALDATFGAAGYSLGDAFLDLRQSVARAIGAERMALLPAVGRELLENQGALLRSLRTLSVSLPAHIQTLATHVLSNEARRLVEELVMVERRQGEATSRADLDFTWRALVSRLRGLAEEASLLGLRLELGATAQLLGDAIVDELRVFGETGDDDRAESVIRLVDACTQLEITPRQWDLQTELFRLIEAARHDARLLEALRQHSGLLATLDDFGGSSFAQRLRRG